MMWKTKSNKLQSLRELQMVGAGLERGQERLDRGSLVKLRLRRWVQLSDFRCRRRLRQ
jgi:hypothetical protein